MNVIYSLHHWQEGLQKGGQLRIEEGWIISIHSRATWSEQNDLINIKIKQIWKKNYVKLFWVGSTVKCHIILTNVLVEPLNMEFEKNKKTNRGKLCHSLKIRLIWKRNEECSKWWNAINRVAIENLKLEFRMCKSEWQRIQPDLIRSSSPLNIISFRTVFTTASL